MQVIGSEGVWRACSADAARAAEALQRRAAQLQQERGLSEALRYSCVDAGGVGHCPAAPPSSSVPKNFEVQITQRYDRD